MKAKYYSPIPKAMILVIDFWLVSLAFKVTQLAGPDYGIPEYQLTSFFLIFSCLWIIAGFLYEVYRVDSLSLVNSLTSNLPGAFVLHILLIAIVLANFQIYQLNLEFLALVYTTTAVLIVGSRVGYKLLWKYFEFSRFDQRKVVIVGVTGSGKALYQYFTSQSSDGYVFKGFFDDDQDRIAGYGHLLAGEFEDVRDYCLSEKVDEIYFTLPITHEELIRGLSKFADENFIYFRLAPDFSKVVNDNYDAFLINSIPILTTRKEPLGVPVNRYLKRAFDVAFSLTVIMLLFPILIPLIAVAIRLDSEGPIFFKQLRPGKKSRLFECYKFRTMHVNGTTEVQATRNDSRVTRVGRFLRKTNLDEIPQFFNVLLGSMSVVGPRPNLISQLNEYSRSIQQYKLRHFVTPGITGYAQVNGFRGETREPGLMEKRVEYDVLYLENWSLALDIKIIFLTVWRMIRGDKNAY